MPKPKAPPPPYPARLDYLWRDFVDIIRGMEGGGFSAPLVSWQGLKAWSEIMGRTLEPWEARLIVHLGMVRADILAEKAADSGRENAN